MNVKKGLVYKEEELILEDCAIEAIRKINESGMLAIVVTNQPVVARGLCGIEEVEKIHQKMKTLLGKEGVYFDDVMFCPHHPDKGYPEENPIYKVSCSCRKPEIGLLEKCEEKYHVDYRGYDSGYSDREEWGTAHYIGADRRGRKRWKV